MAPEGEAAGGQGDTNSAGAGAPGTQDGVAAAAAAAAAPSAEAIAAATERAAADKVVAEKAATEKAAADKATADAAAAAAGGEKPKPGSQAGGEPPKAPDKYELDVPEGFENQQEGFEAMARRQNLTNEQAQLVMNALPDQYHAQSTRFLEETEAHAEIGGEKLEQAQLNAKLVLDKFLPADSEEGAALREGMNITGYGNWTPLVLLLSRIGTHFAEDRPLGFEAARQGAGEGADPATKLYDNPTSVKANSG